jgi:hypothetical protein
MRKRFYSILARMLRVESTAITLAAAVMIFEARSQRRREEDKYSNYSPRK